MPTLRALPCAVLLVACGADGTPRAKQPAPRLIAEAPKPIDPAPVESSKPVEEPRDSDGDGLEDGADSCPKAAEVINGNEDLDGCPDDGKSLVELRDDRIELLEKVRFASRKSTKLDPTSFLLLDQVAALLRLHQRLDVRVEGHHDDTHTDQHGSRLSHAQAQSVARYLIAKGVAAGRIESVGHGGAKPIASNRTEAGRDQNWRIEIWLRPR